VEGGEVREFGTHTHEPNDRILEIVRAKNLLKQKAADPVPTRMVVSEVVGNISGQSAPGLPSVESMKRVVQRYRSKLRGPAVSVRAQGPYRSGPVQVSTARKPRKAIANQRTSGNNRQASRLEPAPMVDDGEVAEAVQYLEDNEIQPGINSSVTSSPSISRSQKRPRIESGATATATAVSNSSTANVFRRPAQPAAPMAARATTFLRPDPAMERDRLTTEVLRAQLRAAESTISANNRFQEMMDRAVNLFEVMENHYNRAPMYIYAQADQEATNVNISDDFH